MSMYEYAKKEIAIAKALETRGQDTDGDFFDYGGACYDSALKAFKSLTEDGHSGFSIGLTQNILNRLIDGKPLTPIHDTDDIWNEVSYDKKNQYTTYQCARMSSLFKEIYEDGSVRYNDINRFICVDINNQSTYHSRLVSDIVEDMYPIEFPYEPLSTPIQVYCEDFLVDPANGDYDTKGVLYLEAPEGSKIIIDKYFKEVKGEWVSITPQEYISRFHTTNFVVKPKIDTDYLLNKGVIFCEEEWTEDGDYDYGWLYYEDEDCTILIEDMDNFIRLYKIATNYWGSKHD